MGIVTSATVTRSDGTIYSGTYDEVLATSEKDALVSYQYAYSPDALFSSSNEDVGLWRYRKLLPLGDAPILYSLPIGNTPLIASEKLRNLMHMPQLWLKDDTRSPTGSNKDRATALVLEHALQHAISTVCCASTGNVAVSLAVGAAASGIRAIVFVPSSVADAKLNIMHLAGATVFKVIEGYEAAFQLSQEAAQAFGWLDRNTGSNPMTLDGKKTVAFEIWEQLGRQMPDVVIIPAGDGITLTAMAKGFRELQACGVTQQLPRFIGVQAECCQPIKRAWENNAQVVAHSHSDGKTIADGIAVRAPSGGILALKDVYKCGGGFVAVSDKAMLQAIELLARSSGVLAEPAAAASLAGLVPALEAGLIEPDELIVIYVTGSGLKQPRYLLPRKGIDSFTIQTDIKAVEKIVRNNKLEI